tara:strand:+ start:130 stop:1152 length:1023 start_codon:yes stop_codon:yes gene_type:complete
MKKKVCFYSNEGYESIMRQQYSIQDVNILRDLDFDVVIASKFSEIPWNSDLYFSWWGGGSVFPLIVAKLRGKPIVVVAGGNEVLFYRDSVTQKTAGYLDAPWYKKIAIRLVLKCADQLIVVSKFMQKGIKCLTNRSVSLAYNSIAVGDFDDFGLEREYVTSIFNFDPGVFALKRGEIFLRAIPYILEDFPTQKFLIIGSDIEKYPDIRCLVDGLNINSSIKFMNSLSNKDIPYWFNKSIAYVQISDTETFGVSVAEAMSTKTPVVVSNKGALPEIAGSFGEYVDHNSPKSVAAGIVKILKAGSNTELLESARNRIVRKFSYSERKKIIGDIVFNLIEKNK